jgi:hypothetical protein
MKIHSKSKSLLALVLAISIAATGCSAQWINIALQDLPVLTQMALNIATLVGTLTAGKQTTMRIWPWFKTFPLRPAAI